VLQKIKFRTKLPTFKAHTNWRVGRHIKPADNTDDAADNTDDAADNTDDAADNTDDSNAKDLNDRKEFKTWTWEF
jgi:hypothetical protein